MISAKEVINSVMDSFNSMEKEDKLAYLDRVGFKYKHKDDGNVSKGTSAEKSIKAFRRND